VGDVGNQGVCGGDEAPLLSDMLITVTLLRPKSRYQVRVDM
jgi:hypothetical protein